MAQVPTEQQIVPEDFPTEDQKVIGAIADPFNAYVQENNEALRNNLTFTDNFRGQLKSLNVVGGKEITFAYALSDFKPIGLWLVSFRNLDNPNEVITTTGVSVQWSQDGKGNIIIKHITGFTPNETYQCTFIAISG